MEYIGLFVCASIGLIITALGAVAVILINKAVPEIDPVDYGWVLLDDTEVGVLAYHKGEFVLNYIPEMGIWEMYSCTETRECTETRDPKLWVVGELTDSFMEDLDSHIEKYGNE